MSCVLRWCYPLVGRNLAADLQQQRSLRSGRHRSAVANGTASPLRDTAVPKRTENSTGNWSVVHSMVARSPIGHRDLLEGRFRDAWECRFLFRTATATV